MNVEDRKTVHHPWRLLDWLSALLAAGIVFVGLFALMDPLMGSALFGAPLTLAADRRWVRIAGIRDISLGLILTVPLLLRHRRIAGMLILFATIIPAGDACVVFFSAGVNPYSLMHAGAAVFMVVLGTLFLRR